MEERQEERQEGVGSCHHHKRETCYISFMTVVLLVDEYGNQTGTADLLAAHTGAGLLHRAFSVYIFRSRGEELLLQHRAEGKRLFKGLWTNTCCSHPLPEESAEHAGMRRLQEEMGFSCPLQKAGSFVYRAEDPKGHGIEYEYDTVLIGMVDDADVHPDPAEVSDWKWMHIDDLTEELEQRSNLFTPWFARGLSLAQESLCTHA